MHANTVKNAPPLYGWVIATGLGLVFFGVSLLLFGLGWNGSIFLGAVVLIVVGVIFTIAENGGPRTGPNERVAPTAPTVSAFRPTGVPDRAGTGAKTAPVARSAAAPVAATTSATTASAATVAAASIAPAPQADPATDGDEGTPPALLDAPRGGKGDNLQVITGLGPVLERKLNELGIWHFDQIAALQPDESVWLDAKLDSKGRVERDGWIAQAKALAPGSGAQP